MDENSSQWMTLERILPTIQSVADSNRPRSEEERKERMLDNFFMSINKFYDHRNRIIEEYLRVTEETGRPPNIIIPEFDVSNDIIADVNSFPGWSATGMKRDTKEKDIVIKKFINKDLDTGKRILVDIGSNDFERTSNYVQPVTPELISHLIGIDSNDVVRNVPELPFPATGVQADFLDHLNDFVNYLPGNKTYIFSENVGMNLTLSVEGQHDGIEPLIGTILNKGDSAIISFSNKYDDKNYVDGIEPPFTQYHECLSDVIGGTLRTFTMNEKNIGPNKGENKKIVVLEDINEVINYKGKQFIFDNPELEIQLNDGTKDKTKAFSKPRVHLGASRSVNEHYHFRIALNLYLTDGCVIEEGDWEQAGNNSIFRVTKKIDYVPENNDHMQAMAEQVATKNNFSKPIFNHWRDYAIIKGDYPEHYNNLLTQENFFFESEMYSDVTKHALWERFKNGAGNDNMHDYLCKLSRGEQVEDIRFDYVDKVKNGIQEVYYPRIELHAPKGTGLKSVKL